MRARRRAIYQVLEPLHSFPHLSLRRVLFSSGVADASYRIAPIFLIRMAGVPFEFLENLATVATAAAARESLVRQTELARAKSAVEELLQSRNHGLSEKLFRAWRKAIRAGTVPPAAHWPSRVFATCWECASQVAIAEASLEDSLQRELIVARDALFKTAQKILPICSCFRGRSRPPNPNNSPPSPARCPGETNRPEPMSDTCFSICNASAGKTIR